MDGTALAAGRAGYDQDFHAWAVEQAALLRGRRFSEVDFEHVAEEIEGLANRDRNKVRSHLRVLLQHLLKYEVRPDLRGRSWKATMLEQRQGLETLLEESPSLAARWDEHLAHAYPRAVRSASLETGIVKERFRIVPLWTKEQILDADFLPDGDAG